MAINTNNLAEMMRAGVKQRAQNMADELHAARRLARILHVQQQHREADEAWEKMTGEPLGKLHEYTHHAWAWDDRADTPTIVCQRCGILRAEFDVAAKSMRTYADLPSCTGVRPVKANALVDALLSREQP